MPRVFAVGETVYDIIFRDGQPVSATPGGSMLNSAVSLGRLGVETFFISEFGPESDPIGRLVNQFLTDNQVYTGYVNRSRDCKTGIALAFLNKENDAEYSFYRSHPEDRLNYPEFTIEENDIVLFGSFFSLNRDVRPMILNLLGNAINAGAIIIYDPNFRKPHLHQLPELMPLIKENLRFPDIIRGSDEDFYHIFNSGNVEQAFHAISLETNSALVYTKNRNGVDLVSPGVKMHLDVPELQPVSTIGAGDNFNAGLIWSLVREGITKKDLEHLSKKQWERILTNSIRFAGNVCMSYSNFISVEFAVEMLNK